MLAVSGWQHGKLQIIMTGEKLQMLDFFLRASGGNRRRQVILANRQLRQMNFNLISQPRKQQVFVCFYNVSQKNANVIATICCRLLHDQQLHTKL